MECPMELWDSSTNRVNESIVSSLQNVRKYLYQYLYNTDIPLKGASAFLDVFGLMNASVDPEVVCANLTVLYDYTTISF